MRFKIWLIENQQDKKSKIRNLIDGQGLIMFFKKDDKVFGAPEESRIIFARMKNPEEDDVGWEDEANFAGYDLMQALQGNSVENLFSAGDLPKIMIINRDQAEDSLMKCPGAEGGINLNPIKGSKDGVGIIKLKDKV